MALIKTKDGSHTVQCEQFGVTYHSIHGSINESLHVFIKMGLQYKAHLKQSINILEVGFGTGLNAYLTLLNKEDKTSINYHSLEAYPLKEPDYKALNYASIIGRSTEEINYFETLHTTPSGQLTPITDGFSLQKVKTLLHDFEANEDSFDLIYFDAFAPNTQPELWTTAIFEKLYKMLKTDGTLVTYCAKGDVKRSLKAAGYDIERLPGPPGKREMIRANKL